MNIKTIILFLYSFLFLTHLFGQNYSIPPTPGDRFSVYLNGDPCYWDSNISIDSKIVFKTYHDSGVYIHTIRNLTLSQKDFLSLYEEVGQIEGIGLGSMTTAATIGHGQDWEAISFEIYFDYQNYFIILDTLKQLINDY